LAINLGLLGVDDEGWTLLQKILSC